MPNFIPGSTDPLIIPDKGAGNWNVESVSADTFAFREAFLEFWPAAVVLIGDDAVAHMFQYFRNDGSDYTIDLEGMVEEVPSAKLLFEKEVGFAKSYVQGLPPGMWTFTSRNAVNGYNSQKQSTNWYFAIGGYSVWSKGTATVTANAAGQRYYQMHLEYKFFDRYNWDGGKSVTLFRVKITDEFMGRMHREGIAKEYNCNGSFTRDYEWGVAAAAPPSAGRASMAGRR